MTASRRVARYIRVSRTDQDPSLQLDETARLIAVRGWDLVDTYTDHGISGSRDHRPALDRMLKDAKTGRFNTVRRRRHLLARASLGAPPCAGRSCTCGSIARHGYSVCRRRS